MCTFGFSHVDSVAQLLFNGFSSLLDELCLFGNAFWLSWHLVISQLLFLFFLFLFLVFLPLEFELLFELLVKKFLFSAFSCLLLGNSESLFFFSSFLLFLSQLLFFSQFLFFLPYFLFLILFFYSLLPLFFTFSDLLFLLPSLSFPLLYFSYSFIFPFPFFFFLLSFSFLFFFFLSLNFYILLFLFLNFGKSLFLSSLITQIKSVFIIIHAFNFNFCCIIKLLMGCYFMNGFMLFLFLCITKFWLLIQKVNLHWCLFVKWRKDTLVQDLLWGWLWAHLFQLKSFWFW